MEFIATALTETAGQIAAAFKKFFNIASPTSTMNEITLVDTVTTYTGYTTPPTAAQNATAIWQDATGTDFTAASLIGKSLLNTTTAAGGSVPTVSTLQNAPSGGGGGSDPLSGTSSHYTTGEIGNLIGVIAADVDQRPQFQPDHLRGSVDLVTGKVQLIQGNDYKAIRRPGPDLVQSGRDLGRRRPDIYSAAIAASGSAWRTTISSSAPSPAASSPPPGRRRSRSS